MGETLISTDVEDDVAERLEALAKAQGKSTAEIIREIFTAWSRQQAREEPAKNGLGDVGALTAKIDALTAKQDAMQRYLCFSRPLEERMSKEEIAEATLSWVRVREWEKELLEKGVKTDAPD